MEKRNLTVLAGLTVLVLIVNLMVFYQITDFSDFRQEPQLDNSKEFANRFVETMHNLAASLDVEERSSVKYALAGLHYDVYLAGNSSDLARIIQNEAGLVLDVIVSEYVRNNGEQVLFILNNAPEVHTMVSKTAIVLEPMPNGGVQPLNSHRLTQETLAELASLPTLFSFEYFQNMYENYKDLSTFNIEVENGLARLILSPREQDIVKNWEREIQTLRNEFNRTSQLAGYSEVSGPGIIIRFTPFGYLEAADLRRIPGELFSSGATGISVGGQRLAANSYIIDDNGGIVVDGVRIRTNPVEIHALGDPDILIGGIELLFNVILWSHDFDIERRDIITLPAKTR